jgi:S1-C subfamily serine protease
VVIPGGWSIVGCLLIAGGLSAGLAARANAQGTQFSQLFEHSKMFLLRSHSPSYLGVDVGDIDLERAQALHLKDAHGAEITVLDHDAPAGKVGLKLHDVVLEINGVAINSAEQMKQMLHEMPVGRKVTLVFSRDGAQQTVSTQMVDRRKMQEDAWQQLSDSGSSGGSGQGFLTGSGDVPANGGFHFWGMGNSLHVGALVEPLTPQMSEFLGVKGGLMIKSVAHKSAADAAGLKQHDVILQVGADAVITSSDWERTLRSSNGKPVQVTVLRGRVKQVMTLEVDGKRHKG